MKTKILFVHTLSPLHPGTGQGVGVIDLPVAREQATGLPYLPGSSLKGVLRDRCQGVSPEKCVPVFGPDTSNADEHAGAAHFSDQRLLLLPVRSLRGTFAWVTSPYLLNRLLRDAGDALPAGIPQTVPNPSEDECIVLGEVSALIFSNDSNKKVILEDLDLSVSTQDAKVWAEELAKQIFPANSSWQTMMAERICIVHDNVLNFLQQTALEVVARIRLQDDTKTVAQSGLWYEEALPTETVLVGIVLAAPVTKTGLSDDMVLETISGLTNKTLQFGGNATVGRGLCRVLLA